MSENALLNVPFGFEFYFSPIVVDRAKTNSFVFVGIFVMELEELDHPEMRKPYAE